MKKIGLIGGIGPASTIDYYWELNRLYHKDFGANNYPRIVIDSINMNDIISAFATQREDLVCEILENSINILKNAGAEVAAICSNTPHIVWEHVVNKFPLPVVSIIDANIAETQARGFSKILILGTLYTMKSGMYERAFTQKHIQSVTPSENDQEIIGNIIFPNLENGIVLPEAKATMIELAEKYIQNYHIDAVLLSCSEIPLMIHEGDLSVPTLNTTLIHTAAIYNAIL